jgi:hypothetical protein
MLSQVSWGGFRSDQVVDHVVVEKQVHALIVHARSDVARTPGSPPCKEKLIAIVPRWGTALSAGRVGPSERQLTRTWTTSRPHFALN